MINKTVRQNAEIAISISEIKSKNPALARESAVSSYAYHQMAADIEQDPNLVDWYEIVNLDFKDSDNIEFAPTRAVSFEQKDFETVLEHFRNSLGLKEKTRVRFSYLTRLVLRYTRNKMSNTRKDSIDVEEFAQVETTTLDGVDLLRRVNNMAAKLIMAGDTGKILKFLEEMT